MEAAGLGRVEERGGRREGEGGGDIRGRSTASESGCVEEKQITSAEKGTLTSVS